ncbi:A/G-specific adenine glycosylase [Sedimentitalea sp. HM32M-2]|uniref:A/G-specific adenine glycosylase n=1 Tax=Sedimentitalea sp. HM32M-2 TaxID=3351566 RepID=UPI003632E97F
MRDTDPGANEVADIMLDWYDRNARALPWRIPPGSAQPADPYRVWLSEVMLQQTTVASVKDYFHRFTQRWPTVSDLASAHDADVMGEWAGLGYYARARNLLKCARVVAWDHGGRFPDTHDALLALPGIGPYTAAAVAAIAFGRAETVMDGNVERVMARLYDIHVPLPAAKPALKARAAALTPLHRPGDYAQAMMDLGATICTPKSPACGLCPLRDLCAALAAGTAADLPKKTAKKPKPTRRGIVYLGRRADGAWLLERRPDRGLLGGMLGWPGSDWAETATESPPVAADWQHLAGEVRHTFTHFHLILTVRSADLPLHSRPDTGFFLAQGDFRPGDLPTVMRKAFYLVQGA